jgi:hypothetical protein
MVKRQRRMTVKKNTKAKPSPKVKKLVRSSAKPKRPASQTDRANQAMKTLAKRLQKMEDRE